MPKGDLFAVVVFLVLLGVLLLVLGSEVERLKHRMTAVEAAVTKLQTGG